MSTDTPRFKRIAVILFCLFLVLKIFGFASGKVNEAKALKYITPSEVVLSDLKEMEDSGLRKLSGRITNKSPKYLLNAVALRIVYKDCQEGAGNQNCSTLGKEKAVIMRSVLPGETKDFSTIIPSNRPVATKSLVVDRLIEYVEAGKIKKKSDE